MIHVCFYRQTAGFDTGYAVETSSAATGGRALDLLFRVGSGAQADDRQFAVGFLLVLRETLCRAGDVAPRLLAGIAVQLLGVDRNGAAGDLDLHGVGWPARL